MLCQVEAVLNSRPMTYISESDDDLMPLSPSMFLNDIRETRFPEVFEIDTKELKREYRSLRQLRAELEHRFRREYLSLLVHRGKEKGAKEIAVGDVVLVGCDNRKRLEWPLARVLAVFPGKDGHVRVARLQTSSGTLIRPVQRLFPLEVSSPREASTLLETKNSVSDGKVSPVVTRSGREVKEPNRFVKCDQ